MVSLIMRPRGRGCLKGLESIGQDLTTMYEYLRPIWGWLLLALAVAMAVLGVWYWVNSDKDEGRKLGGRDV